MAPRLPVLVALVLPLLVAAAGCNRSSGSSGSGDMLPGPDLAMGGDTLDTGTISSIRRGGLEAESSVAVAASGWVAAAWIASLPTGASNNGYAFSTDDGLTWMPPQSLASPGGRVSSDPVLAVDAQGTFYLTWIGFRRATQGTYDMHVYVARAPAGTTSFVDTVEVTSLFDVTLFDKPWITVLNDGTVLITFARTSMPTAIYAARSTNYSDWDIEPIVADNGFRNLVFPCHGSTGSRVYAAYHAGGGIGLRWSEDGGTTWNDEDKSAVVPMGEGRPAFDDPTCATEGDDVWVVYGLSADAFSEDISAKLDSIRIAHSGDGGKTFDTHDDAHDPAAGIFYMHPYLVREASGALDLAYYAGMAEGDPMGSFRRSRSTDGGRTWTPSVAVRAPLLFTGSRDTPQWLGDYAGVAWTRNNLYFTYTDNHDTASHVDFYRTAAPPRM